MLFIQCFGVYFNTTEIMAELTAEQLNKNDVMLYYLYLQALASYDSCKVEYILLSSNNMIKMLLRICGSLWYYMNVVQKLPILNSLKVCTNIQ